MLKNDMSKNKVNKPINITIPNQTNFIENINLLYKEETNSKNCKIGYITDSINIRAEPDTNSKILTVLSINTQIEYTEYNKNWAMINYEGIECYINSKYISDKSIKYIEHCVLENNIKSYMPYTAIKAYDEYELQQKAYTDDCGIRKINGRYCIALGSFYSTKIGTYIDLILENDEIIPCILGDCKADKDTDIHNQITKHDGSVVEFIVDISMLNKNVQKTGDISYVHERWKSPVIVIKVYEKGEY